MGGYRKGDMYRPKDTQERILHRYKIINGHLKKVVEMVEKDEYCIDIIHQSQAIQQALKQIDNLLLENHLTTCVSDAIKQGDDKKAIAEVMSVFNKQKA